LAAVVRELVAALHDRAECVEGKNFLRTASCDVDAAARISRALSADLPRSTAVDLLPLALDPDRWAAWTAPSLPALTDAGPRSSAVATRTITLSAVPPPVVVAPPVVTPPPVVVPPPVVAQPPAPAPVVPAPPPVAAAVVPAPAPAGNPTPSDWWASVLQQLAAQNSNPTTGNGKGNGNGHGHGRGHD
jgi:hypothetical protein